MGKKKKAPVKIVLDTNVIVSAILFSGEVSRIWELWKVGKILPAFTRATFQELQRVLEYPKFDLTETEIRTILEQEVLPYFSAVDEIVSVTGACEDPDDDKFLSCALSYKAEFLISGDKDLAKKAKYKSVRILAPSDFLRKLY